MNFDWENFKNNKIGVCCKTENEAKDFVNKCLDNNFNWYVESYNTNKETNYYGSATIYSYEEDRLCRSYDNWYKENDYSILEWSDYMDDTYKKFTKQDLKAGMIVELRNGEYGMVLLGTKNGDIISGTTWLPINGFDENLNCYINYDVIKIYQPKSNRDFLYDGEIHMDEANLIWERKEEPQPKEMTVEEIEKALGYSVKIVK